MSKIFKNENFYLVPILILAILIRYLYYIHAPGVIVSEDTYSYYLTGQEILKTKIPVGDYRTPVYPLFLHLVTFLSGSPNAPILSQPFFNAMFYTIIIQSVLGLCSLIILYKSLRLLKLNIKLAYAFTLFTGVNIILFSWERLLLTESMAIFILISVFFVILKILENPKFTYFLILFCLLLTQVMLRPIYVAFPIIPLFIIPFLLGKKRVLTYSLLVVVVYFITLSIYAKINYRLYGVHSITRASDITMLGKILDFKLPIENAKDERFYYEAVTKYRQEGRELNPFRFLEYNDLIRKDRLLLLLKLNDFDAKVLTAVYPEYIGKSLLRIPGSLLDTSEKIIVTAGSNNFLDFLFKILFQFYKYLQFSFLIIFPCAPIAFFNFLKKPSYESAIVSILGGISLYQIIFAVFFGYSEFGRLICIAQPMMYLFSFYCWWKILRVLHYSSRSKWRDLLI